MKGHVMAILRTEHRASGDPRIAPRWTRTEGHDRVDRRAVRRLREQLPGSEYLTTSDQFLELDALPARILFVGGGYVSFELAHVAARAGAQVTVVHRGQRRASSLTSVVPCQ